MHASAVIEAKTKRMFSSTVSLKGNSECLELDKGRPRDIEVRNFVIKSSKVSDVGDEVLRIRE